MFFRRSLPSLAVLIVAASSCRLFRPVNPNAEPEPQPAEAAAAAAAAAAPEVSPDTAAPPAPAVEPAAAPTDVGRVSDANIAAMLLASNNTDISYARLVPSRASRTDVREYASRMLTDHTTVNGMVMDFLRSLDLTPEDNAVSLGLRDESSMKRDIMRDLTGYAFDSTYIDNEVGFHRTFLATLDEFMMPRAHDDKLKELLNSVRPAVAAHLAHAEQVRSDVLTRK